MNGWMERLKEGQIDEWKYVISSFVKQFSQSSFVSKALEIKLI